MLIDGSVEDGQPEAEEWIHQVEKTRDPSHRRFLTPNGWKKLCEEAGFQVLECRLDPFKQPDLLIGTLKPPRHRRKTGKRFLSLVRNAPEEARRLFGLTTEDGKIVWWWRRLTLVAKK